MQPCRSNPVYQNSKIRRISASLGPRNHLSPSSENSIKSKATDVKRWNMKKKTGQTKATRTAKAQTSLDVAIT
jgi:hypothetical protein